MKEYHLSIDDYFNLLEKDSDGKYIVKDYGTIYYKNGFRHRLDGPACYLKDGTIMHFISGELFKSKEEYDTAVYLYKNNLENYQ